MIAAVRPLIKSLRQRHLPLTSQARGFATWEANHKHIQFRDVGGTGACTTDSGAWDDPCPWQLFVGTDDGKTYPTLAAYVINQRTSTFPEAFPKWWEATTRSPAGVVDAGSDPLRRSVMRFQTHLCWYLDATFCYYFHSFQEQGLEVLLLMRLGLFGLFIFAVCCVGYIIAMAALVFLRQPPGRDSEAEARREISRWSNARLSNSGSGLDSPGVPSGRGSGTEAEGDTASGRPQRRSYRRRRALLDYLAAISPLAMIGLLFFLVFPPIFYDQIFLPCWECFDFEAAIAHEVSSKSVRTYEFKYVFTTY